MKQLLTLTACLLTLCCYSQKEYRYYLEGKELNMSDFSANIYIEKGYPIVKVKIPDPLRSKIKTLYLPSNIIKATDIMNQYCARDTVNCLSVDLIKYHEIYLATILYKRIYPIKITKN